MVVSTGFEDLGEEDMVPKVPEEACRCHVSISANLNIFQDSNELQPQIRIWKQM